MNSQFWQFQSHLSRNSLLRGGQGWIRAPFSSSTCVGTAIHITHWVCKKSVPFLRTDTIGYFRASNSRRHALGILSWAGSSQRPCKRRTYNQSITTKCRQRLSLGRSLGKPCPRRHALGMLSLAGSVPAPCERRTYTLKQNPNIFMQWGWELSQQWSSGEFRQIRVCNQKGQKGSTGRLRIKCPYQLS